MKCYLLKVVNPLIRRFVLGNDWLAGITSTEIVLRRPLDQLFCERAFTESSDNTIKCFLTSDKYKSRLIIQERTCDIVLNNNFFFYSSSILILVLGFINISIQLITIIIYNINPEQMFSDIYMIKHINFEYFLVLILLLK